jgi:ATP-dependent RNA helicase HrpB
VTPLPIDPYVPQVLAAVRSKRAVIVTAAPGAGKTTRVPPALAEDGPVIVLQPRRIAARAMARRVAAEQGWTAGREAGWHVRFERRFGPATRILFATEGILTARLQQDPLLTDFRTIVLDEFHERSIHADLGLALARQAWRARDDLRIVVMSATLDAEPVSAFLGSCPVLSVPGRLFPLDVRYRPGAPLAAVTRELLPETDGSILCFLPGAPEINRALAEVRTAAAGVEVVPLHGSLPSDEQDRAIDPSPVRRVILSTNIAETSLTVPGVTAVIDAGLQKIARYDPDRGIDSLELERISAQSAEQRAGRAGRVAAGHVRRLWSEADRLREQTDPEVRRVDLSDAVLDILAWGGDPLMFEWFDPPDRDRVAAALTLLQQLGAVAGGKLTAIGERMKRLPLHPRLARMLIESGAREDVAFACALLSDRHALPAHPETTVSDLLAAADRGRTSPPHIREVARRLLEASRDAGVAETAPSRGEKGFLRAVFAGYPDRAARRRSQASPRFLLASGHGAVLGRESGVRDAEFIVAVDVHAGRRGEGAEATIRIASAIEIDWLAAGENGLRDVRVVHELDAAQGRVRAVERELYGEITLTERPADFDPDVAARLLAQGYLQRGLTDEDAQLFRRLRFAGREIDPASLVASAASGRRSLAEIDLRGALDWKTASDLDRVAPDRLVVPSGRATRLRYDDVGGVTASVKLQELFGLAETPRLGPRETPVTFELLAPNGRPVQTTRDLRSFWNSTYQEVRKELRGRYPKHPWPEDPWTALPTARAKRRT